MNPLLSLVIGIALGHYIAKMSYDNKQLRADLEASKANRPH